MTYSFRVTKVRACKLMSVSNDAGIQQHWKQESRNSSKLSDHNAGSYNKLDPLTYESHEAMRFGNEPLYDDIAPHYLVREATYENHGV